MSSLFTDIMKNGALDSLIADQLDELILRAQEIRSEQQDEPSAGMINACPHCGSIALKKHGTTSNARTAEKQLPFQSLRTQDLPRVS